MNVTVVMYHYVRNLRNSRYPQITGLDELQFRQQLDYLTANYTIVRTEDVLSFLDSGTELPENAALLTFDDGYIDHFVTVFPLLDKLGIQGSFFPSSIVLENGVPLIANMLHYILAASETGIVYDMLTEQIEYYRGSEFEIPDLQTLINESAAMPSRWDSTEAVFIKRMLQTVLPERLRRIIASKLLENIVGIDEKTFSRELYCDTEQLAMMKKHGMYIGLHGHAHNRFGKMNKSEYEYDITHALEYMDSIGLVDKKAWVMNYPYGSYSNDVVEYCRTVGGCLAGLTIEPRVANLRTDDRLLIPRLNTNDFPPVNTESYESIKQKR